MSVRPQVHRLRDLLLHMSADALDVELVVPEGVGELRVLIYEGTHLRLHLLQAHLGVLLRDRSVLKGSLQCRNHF